MAFKNHSEDFTTALLTLFCCCLEADVDLEVVYFLHKSTFHENKSNSLGTNFFSTSIKSCFTT